MRLKIMITAMTVALFLLTTAVPVGAITMQLTRDTQVKVKFAPGTKISSGTLAKDAVLDITLAEPIVSASGDVLVEAGAKGTAKVVDVQKASKPGKPGSIKIQFVDLETKGAFATVDGAKIKLAGTVEGKGKGKKIFPYLFFVLIMSGGQGQISVDSVNTATVAESIVLDSK